MKKRRKKKQKKKNAIKSVLVFQVLSNNWWYFNPALRLDTDFTSGEYINGFFLMSANAIANESNLLLHVFYSTIYCAIRLVLKLCHGIISIFYNSCAVLAGRGVGHNISLKLKYRGPLLRRAQIERR